ncbi:N-acetyl-D-glucosamine kinase [Eurytemora carolleeae]|uniref:N-acetyl-D-glucosamine kinase n=1 Tax=Eurytemora carolleeae TaxID=1294199 RepID=UPI000C75B8DF|nr:N-acetyl-D-glucosamine kinase [Eurytemora carolleeae]|eukprot:XP_023348203.1 N-acetyl-D-glucosamine kinase-like [Eurytemora affinis]
MGVDDFYGGVEGGGTHSTTMIFRGNGELVATIEGPSTNHYQIGKEETSRRVEAMVREAFKQAGLEEHTNLQGLGLGLSGLEDEETANQLISVLQKLFPHLALKIIACSDTRGTLATATQTGGIVLIAGTGSNGLLLNKDGSEYRCGGWGHMMGDEGGAWWIANRACKLYFDSLDNIVHNKDISLIEKLIFEHFSIKDRFGMLYHLYENFNKSFFASLTSKLAAAANQGDEICIKLFHDAGAALGNHVKALAPNVHRPMMEGEGGLKVVCVGSVWKSWSLLKPGFIQAVAQSQSIPELSLVELAVGMATGATYLGAQAADYNLPRDYSKNVKQFFHYKKESS